MQVISVRKDGKEVVFKAKRRRGNNKKREDTYFPASSKVSMIKQVFF